jgi:hypothetical protein
MKFVAPRPFADPDVAARKLVEIANDVEAVMDGRINTSYRPARHDGAAVVTACFKLSRLPAPSCL